MADPMIVIGLIIGIVIGIIYYWFKRNWKQSLLYVLVIFLGVGTLLHFIIAPIIIAVLINRLLHRYIKKNWVIFLLSVPGVILVLGLLSSTINLYIVTSISGPMSLGEALGRGIGMGLMFIILIIAGLIVYLITIVTLLIIDLKKRKIKV